MSEDLQQQLRQIGKGLQQLNIKLVRLTESVDAQQRPDEPLLGALLDLFDGVELALAGATPGDPHWQGLRICRDQAQARLADAGLTLTPTTGPHNPALHQVIEILDAPTPAHHHQLARTFRRGWVRADGSGGEKISKIVRIAQVSVYFHKEHRSG